MSNKRNVLKDVSPPDLTNVLQEHKRDIFTTLNCVQIGEIVDFDSGDQTASVKLLLKKVISVEPDGTRILQEHPVLLKCPVIILYGGVSFLTFPIAPGDNCVVLFNDREFDEWFVNGGTQTPQSFRAHDLSDAIALVGINSMQTALANYLANGIRLQYDSTSKIELTANAINSLADLFLHTGDFRATGNIRANGQVRGATLYAENGATGSGDVVTVVNGIVTSVS